MTEPTRRTFLQTVAAAVPATAVASHVVRPKSVGARALDREQLIALSEAVLPSELGTEGSARIADAFLTWLEDYRPGAERNHGYGTGEIEHNPEDPGPRWREQAQSLDRDAQRRLGVSFATASVHDRRNLVADSISAEESVRFPAPIFADHVAIALLAFFYSSPEATNLCYGAAINKQSCRPLSESPAAPIVLPREEP